jgi:NADH dehydrogenase
MINAAATRVLLLEGGARILASFPPELSLQAAEQLKALGVEIHTGQAVNKIDDQGVWLGEKLFSAATILWAAGIAASPLTQSLGVPLDRAGRVIVEADLSLPQHREVFAIGDITAFLHQGGKPLPGVSPVAMQQARAVAHTIVNSLQGRASEPFHYKDKGSMATIGRSAAVADFGHMQLTGFLAWLSWLLVHIFFLIGFRNRFIVIFNWMWSYFTYQRGARLITGHYLPVQANGKKENGTVTADKETELVK